MHARVCVCASARRQSVYSAPQALRWAIQVASAMQYLHEVCRPMIIHRDMKVSRRPSVSLAGAWGWLQPQDKAAATHAPPHLRRTSFHRLGGTPPTPLPTLGGLVNRSATRAKRAL